MRIKHKDLKLANILVIEGRVSIADFGIAKYLIDKETTVSLTGADRGGTPMYRAPEIESDTQKRGRAVDIFALGCIFLEMATFLIVPPGSSGRFLHFRETDGKRAFSKCLQKLLQWIWHL